MAFEPRARARPAGTPSRWTGAGGAEREEAALQRVAVRPEQRLDQRAPALQAVAGPFDEWHAEARRPVHQLGVDPQVLQAAFGVVQLGGERPDQRADERAQLAA